MTRETARIIVEQLDNYLSHTCQDYGERDHEAMTIAIKALEQEPCYNPDEWCHDCSEYNQDKHCCHRWNKVIRNTVEEMKEPKVGHCKDCKYFEYDHFENMGGIPLITAHKVCKRHGLICKTDEDGYCHLWEHKAESEDKE